MIDKVKKMVGGLGNSWGDFLKGLIEPGIYDIFDKRGIEIHNKYSNVKEFVNDKTLYEIDLLLFNDKYVLIVEMKSKLLLEHIEQHKERLKKIQQQPPHDFNLKNKTAIGVVAGISVEPKVIEFAQQNGFYVMVQKSNLVEIVNTPQFSPREWQLSA